MPIFWDLDPSRDDSVTRQQSPAAQRVRIGVVNNMPNGAMQATERQFFSLLGAAAEGIDVQLSIYALPEVPRSDSSQRYVKASYYDIERLWDSHLDGLIVTGMEPVASNLAEEPYWGSLTKVLEWAEDNTHASVWSCLAAHAAVLYLDGITRRRLMDKRCGVFDCTQASDHELTAGAPALLRVPHSRWNDIAETDLARCGYRILTRATDGGVDSFVKRRNSLFIFFQGHLEYEANTLLLEYRRDIGRYLRGERDTYPLIPQSYFDAPTTAALAAFEEQAISDRRVDVLADFPTALAEKNLAQPWRTAAVRIYRNWLAYLSARKKQQRDEKQARKQLARETGCDSERCYAAD
jgi:homoserine O-succinyltransferase/O-acetyltransferase